MDADGSHRFRNAPFGRDVVQAPGGASGLSMTRPDVLLSLVRAPALPSATCRFREPIPHPVQPLSTLRTPRCRDARKTRSRPACSALNGPDFHWQAHSSFPLAPRIRLPPRVVTARRTATCRMRSNPGSRGPGSVPGARGSDSHSLRPLPLAPPTPPPVARLCSPASALLRQGPTSHARSSCASALKPSACGPGRRMASWSGVRPPRFRRDPFVRDVAFDPGRATAPRIAAPHMSPSP